MAVFRQARAKFDWANQHIAKLDARIEALQNSDIATVEFNPEFGNEVIKHDIGDSSAITDLALIAGDAIHNLKCALDYAWIETIKKLVPTAVGRFAKFPVYPTRDELEAALRGKEIDRTARDLFDVVLTKIKPYAGGNFAIWPIHRLDIRDKHRLLIPVIFYSSIRGIKTQDHSGYISDGFTMATTQQPPWYIDMPRGVHVKNEGQVSISVMFEHGIAGSEVRIVDSFSLYSRFIFQVIETLEALI